MSIAEIPAQIADIQARIAMLAPQPTAAAGSGAAFATALDGATATGGTAATASTSGTTLSGTGVTGDDVAQAALQYKGVPYVLGGESKSGIDCSGLVQASFKSLGVDVPRLVHQQQEVGQKVDSLKDAKPGDLIVLNGGDHIAIWMGNGQAIHAPYPGRSVSVQKAWFDDSDITTIRRVVPATADAGTTSALAGASATTSTGVGAGASPAVLAQATAMLGMYGASAAADGTAGGSSTAGSLASMLGTAGASASGSNASLSALLSSGATGSSSTAQQLLAARSALLGSGS